MCMRHKNKRLHIQKSFTLNSITKLLSLTLFILPSQQVMAENFKVGDFDISFDSTFSYGGSWRVESRDRARLTGKSNNLDNGFDFSRYVPYVPNPDKATIWAGQGSYSNNGDNGNLSYGTGDMFSSLIKGTHELDIRRDNVGMFVRGTYFYDFVADNTDWKNPSSGKRFDPCRDEEAQERICKDIRLLDAFIYGDFEINNMPLSLRLGQQVISWGESSLISHGISELNPVDIAILKAPGAELKEAFIPFGALWASYALSDDVNIEAFYQYSWEKTILPAPGSYFSTNDFAGSGGHYNNVQLGFSGIPDMDSDYLLSQLNGLGTNLQNGLDQNTAFSIYMAGYTTSVSLRAPGKKAENEPENGGQYGLRLSWYLPELNDTEISAYYMNYHSRRPVFSGVAANFTPSAVIQDLGFIATNILNTANYDQLQAFSRVELDYIEDIKLYAFSFNTLVGETSVAGEVSYRQDEPLQIDDVELLFAAMPQQLVTLAKLDDPAFDNLNQYEVFDGLSQIPVHQSGERINGYVLANTLQAQVTLTHLFGPSFGASQLTTLIEIGGVDVRNIEDSNGVDINNTTVYPNGLRLNGPNTNRSGGLSLSEPYLSGVTLQAQNGVETNPFPTDFSWGYKMVAKLNYTNVFAGINVTPRIVFSHDVNGITPDPLFLFVEDRKAASLGLNFDYQSRWSADFSYNGFWGGVGTTNQMADRDYLSFSIKYAI